MLAFLNKLKFRQSARSSVTRAVGCCCASALQCDHSTKETARPEFQRQRDGEWKHRSDIAEQVAGIQAAIAHVETIHRELSSRRIRELEKLMTDVKMRGGCYCGDLDLILARFCRLRDSLMPILIREQCILMPAVKRKIEAEPDSAERLEEYRGEFADLARAAAADHNFLRMLCGELERDVRKLRCGENQPPAVASLAAAISQFTDLLRATIGEEDRELLPKLT